MFRLIVWLFSLLGTLITGKTVGTLPPKLPSPPTLPPPPLPDPATAARYAALLFGFLATWEGVQLTARHDYVDPKGTIVYCLGATYPYERRPVHIGQKFTRAECSQIFREDIKKYEGPVRECVNNFDAMPDHRKVAIVSIAYNIGPGRVCKSIAPYFNRGDVRGGCNKLLQYTKASGVTLRGLQHRRAAEREYCLRND